MNRVPVRLSVLALMALPVGSHPMHTTLTEIRQSGTEVTIVVRGFVDDLGRAAGAEGDRAVARYLVQHLVLTAPNRGRLPLDWRAVRHQADVAWFTYTAKVDSDLRGYRIANTALCELYGDQVNIVQITLRATRRSLLFSPGDPPREIR